MASVATLLREQGVEGREGAFVVTAYSITTDGTASATVLTTNNNQPVKRVEIEGGLAYTLPTSPSTISVTAPTINRTISARLFS